MRDAPRLSLRRESTADQIAHGLAEMIMRGELAAGQTINESALATQLGVSRNTVREAVRVLEQSVLVRHEMHRGAVVREPSAGEIAELYGARLALEPLGIDRVELPDGLAPLREAIAALERATAADDVAEIVVRDLAVHAAIVAMIGNPRIDRFFAELTTELRFYVRVLSVREQAGDRREEALAEHREILTALEAGERDRARALVVAHLDESYRRLAEILSAAQARPSR